MIFIGDIASPNEFTTNCLNTALIENKSIFSNKRLICNFEGLIFNNPVLNKNEPILFNHRSILDILNQGLSPVLCMANNHILDLPDQYKNTLNLFRIKEIIHCGSGNGLAEAESPAVFYENSNKIMLFNTCWNFLLYKHSNPRSNVFVAVLNEKKILLQIQEHKKLFPNSFIVVYLHWNLDFETLPFPMYRKFSRALIDSGASIIIGSHSHCVQGGEKYKNGFIIYGLGNFFIPSNQYIQGKLVYPEMSAIELAFEWDPDNEKAICHWFKYENNSGVHNLVHLCSEEFENSEMLKSFSPYINMNDDQYLNFYLKNRRKRFLIPVFNNYQSNALNGIKTFLLKGRAKLAHNLARINIINWQN